MDHAEYHLIEAAFVEGFRQASDRLGFLRLANIPMELPGRDGAPGMKLLRVCIEDVFDVGVAAPGFGTRDLVYHPLPGERIKAQAGLRFVYVSAEGREDLSLADVIAHRDGQAVAGDDHAHGHHHHHHHVSS